MHYINIIICLNALYAYDDIIWFVLMEITKVVKPFIRRGLPNTFDNIVYMQCPS